MPTRSRFVPSLFLLLTILYSSAASCRSIASETNGLIVVAPQAFHPALAEFIAHKQKLLPTRLESLEHILNASQGVDDPEKLKRFLYAEWRKGSLRYALLVGDVDVMPVRYMVLDRVTPAAFDYAFYPSDLYYSDLAKPDGSFDDWNAHKESFHASYFGEVRGEKNKSDPINYDNIDYLPDIAVGRWPVSMPDECRIVAAKTIAAEQRVLAGDVGSLRKAAFVAVGGWVDGRDLMDRLAVRLKGWEPEKYYYSDAARKESQPPNHDSLREIFNQGAGLVVHCGHGSPDSWDQCLSVRDLDRVTNAAASLVVISAGCSTAYFAPLPPYEPYVDVDGKEHAGTDHQEVFSAPPPPPSPYQRGRFNPTGLGEQLLKRGPSGAVAYIGCNTGGQPCGLTLLEGFVTTLSQEKQPHLGDCWAGGVRFYFEHEHLATLKPNDDWYPPSIFFQGMKYMLFGDPSLRLPANEANSGKP